MKTYITLLIALLFSGLTLFGQRKQGYDTDSRWFWTMNAGGTWTTTDVKSKTDWGWGLTIGKSFNYNYGKIVSVDIRGRYLGGNWYGQDGDTTGFTFPNNALSTGNTNYKDSLGFTVLNHKTKTQEVSLELVLHLNSLREKTGWDLYVFGGVGIVGYKTNGNLLNSADSNALYKYGSLPSYSASTISNLLDDSYETTIDGSKAGQFNARFMPSLGFGIGYQFLPRFSMGVEHKTTFTMTDGYDGYFNPTGKYENDWYHYTSAYMRFHIKKREPGTNVVDEIEQAPEVVYTHPNVTGTTVTEPNYNIKALVKYVNGRSNINFRQNNNYVGDFTYNANSDQFSSNVVLIPGQNVFEIVASNAHGTDQETMIINYRVQQDPLPIVSFINPNTNPYNTNVQSFNLSASVLNVQNSSQIVYTVNGQTISNFNFTPANGSLLSNFNLNIGTNIVTITATNNIGSDSKTTTIIYNPAQNTQAPVVYFVNPNVNPLNVDSPNYTINAEVMHVDGYQNITFKQNGTINQNFTYNANNDDFQSAIILVPGQNVFEIIATNTAGTAQASTVIIYARNAPKPPVVTITNPSTNPSNVSNNIFPLNASVFNVSDQSQVKVELNGQNLSNFNFTAQNAQLSATLTLVDGTNTIKVTGTNSDGTDSKQVVIIYKKTLSLQAPVVTYISPASSPTTVSVSSMKISASVLNVSGQENINVSLNGVNFSSFDFNNSTKIASMTVNLIEGVNVLVLTGTNTVGVDSKSTTIIYKKADVIPTPIVTYLDPIINPLTVFNPSYLVKARVQNVNSNQNISLKINGNTSSAFTYNVATETMQFNTFLNEGANIFEITAANTSGQDSKTTTIIYKKSEPLAKPIVNISNPNLNPTSTSSATFPIVATILNVESAQNVQIFVNGAVYNGFSFNVQTKQLNFVMSLNEGNNTIQIKAFNAAGEDQQTKTINYKKAVFVKPPLVTFINPSKPGLTVNNSNFTVRANALNVDNIDELLVSQNGMTVNANLYSFNFQTKEINFNTGLNLGNNLFTISATNGSGTHSATTNIIYKKEEVPCNNPQITFVNPLTSGTQVTLSAFGLKAKISNVTNSSQIQVYLNGVVQNSGIYTAGTQLFNLNVNLSAGQNALEIVAKNACGETKSSTIIIYQKIKVPCEAPILQLIQPINMESTVDLSTYEIRVGVLNIKNSSEISFSVNGVNKAFNFNASSQILIANIDLVEGLNTISVHASNACGSGGFSIKMTRKVCKAPKINITYASAAENSTSTMEAFKIEGNVTDILDRSQLTITQNGNPINFIFNDNLKTFSFSTSLNLKVNNFEIIATSTCGTDRKMYKVTRIADPNAVAPVITITNPAVSPYNTTIGAYNVQATTQFVTSANQVGMTINGQNVNPNFNTGNGSLTYNLSLVEGANVIVATAVNAYGSSSDTKTIIYTKPEVVLKPVVVITNPKSCPAILPEGMNLIEGYILNITNLNQVSITLNGATVSNYNPVLFNGKLSYQFNVNMAANNNNLNLVITAKTKGGSDSKSCLLKMEETKQPDDCKPVISTDFIGGSKSVKVTSNKDLINVVLKFFDGTTETKANLTGMAGSFRGTGANTGKCIVGAWIRSGCNETNFGPGYGEWYANPQNTSDCATANEPENCQPVITTNFNANSKSVSVTSDKDLINVVLKYYDGQEQMFASLSGKTKTLIGTGANGGKCIVGVWVKSGCNSSTDGQNYGTFFKNNTYTNQCEASVTTECGVRFNPAADFCLITTSGSITKDNLTSNPNYTYSGAARNVYFTAIAGGTVTVNGVAMELQSGTTYLFTGNISVEVKNPTSGGNGQWSICITTSQAPSSGKGPTKPASPCANTNKTTPGKTTTPGRTNTPVNRGGR